jgi:poly(3-hydroxybutyrate) depolymerase
MTPCAGNLIERAVAGACALLGWWACAAATAAAAGSPLPSGEIQRALVVAETAIEVRAYKPASYRGGPLLISFHGLSRNTERYLDAAKPLAERHGLLLVVPLFDRARFPYWRYQGLGITRQSRRVTSGPIPVEPPETWTSTLITGLIEEIRRLEGNPGLDYYLIGHSAGGQIGNRMAAFGLHAARRIVVANPSSYVAPTRAARFPYGFGALPQSLSNDDALRRYLAQPMTILAGTDDVLDRDLDVRPLAMDQGATRFERARNVFNMAQALARARGWPFNWRLVEVRGVGHDVRAMYGGQEIDSALFGTQ